MEIMLVDLNHVAKIAGETLNCTWAKIVRQIFSLFMFWVSIVQDDQLSASLIITRKLILPDLPKIPGGRNFFVDSVGLRESFPANF
jgi:hypothetical protein